MTDGRAVAGEQCAGETRSAGRDILIGNDLES